MNTIDAICEALDIVAEQLPLLWKRLDVYWDINAQYDRLDAENKKVLHGDED